MKRARFTVVLRVALGIGLCIDAYVGVLALFVPQAIPRLLDIPMHDPTLARIAGGEYVVAALVYGLVFRQPRRFRALLWLCALDQLFAVVMPGLAVLHGALPPSWKIVVPIPFQALLAVIFVIGAIERRDDRFIAPRRGGT